VRIQPGALPRGEDFHDREQLLARLWACLEAGQHVLLLAPRRFGKSAVLERLRDQAPAGWQVHLLRLEDVDRPSVILIRILLALQEGRPLDRLLSRLHTVPRRVREALQRHVKSVGYRGTGIELREEFGDHWRPIGQALLEEAREMEGPVLLLLDEFPMAVENMHLGDVPAAELRSLLGWFRDLRQEAAGLRVVLAGSVGLDAVLAVAGLPAALINDLRRETVGPFPPETARAFLAGLFASQGIQAGAVALDLILELVGSPVPYFLQDVAHNLVQDTGFRRDPDDLCRIREVYEERVIRAAQHSAFYWYRERLDSRYRHEREAVHAVLTEVAHRGAVGALEVWEIYCRNAPDGGRRLDFDLLVRDLRSDFYLDRDPATDEYRFFLEVFRRWWKEWSHRLPGEGNMP